MSKEHNERRSAERIDYEGEARLAFADDSYPVTLLDLSLNGARLSSEQPLAVEPGASATLTVQLDDSDITLTLPALLIRQHGQELGLRFQRIPLDSLQHLRRLVLLHLQDDADDNPGSALL